MKLHFYVELIFIAYLCIVFFYQITLAIFQLVVKFISFLSRYCIQGLRNLHILAMLIVERYG
jgi:hypothetical protein